MEMSILGRTGLKVSRLGAGLAEIGEELTLADLGQISTILNGALDGGINFLDTGECYFDSEEMLGRTIAHRRKEYILATKCGHTRGGLKGNAWEAQTLRDSIARSLRRLKTDCVDLLQLHSCDVAVLEKGDAIQVLQEAKKKGQTRFIGYSGDNEAARWAVNSGLFDTLQTSYSVVDQHARTKLFEAARAKKMGIIAKRPIGSGAWGSNRSPSAELKYNQTYGDEYFERSKAMLKAGPIPGAPADRILVSLGFVLAHPDVHTAILGTMNPSHMKNNLELLKQMPIPAGVVQELQRRFDRLGENWLQLM